MVDREIVRKAEPVEGSFLRSNLWGDVWVFGKFWFPGITIVLVVLSWSLLARSHDPLWIVALFDGIGASFALIVAWVVLGLYSNYGVAIEDTGILVFTRTLRPSRLRRWRFDWDELPSPVAAGASVLLPTPSLPHRP